MKGGGYEIPLLYDEVDKPQAVSRRIKRDLPSWMICSDEALMKRPLSCGQCQYI